MSERDSDAKCSFCFYGRRKIVLKPGAFCDTDNPIEVVQFECHRFPPTGWLWKSYPIMYGNDWCGEFLDKRLALPADMAFGISEIMLGE